MIHYSTELIERCARFFVWLLLPHIEEALCLMYLLFLRDALNILFYSYQFSIDYSTTVN